MNKYGFSNLKGSKNIICGLGRSNEAVMKYLYSKGAELIVSDKRKSENEITEVLCKLGIKKASVVPYVDFPRADFIYRTPGMRPDLPEICSAIQKGALLTSEVELFFELAKGKIYGITGSDGKTTTTTITYELLKRKYGSKNTFIGGNIGVPLVSFLEKLSDDSVTACELSSFQLMTMTRSPHVSALTNITENHLDYHRDMKEYVQSKCNIYANPECSRLVISDNAYSLLNDSKFKLPSQIVKTGASNDCVIALKDGYIMRYGQPILDVSKIKVLGKHNIFNYMTAIGMTFDTVTNADIEAVATSFGGVEHRIELVCEKNGVKYYNSSIDSSPSRTVNTLACFDEKNVTLICGGYDKNLDYTEFADVVCKKVDKVVLLGANKDKIKTKLLSRGYPSDNIYIADDLNDSVNVSSEISKPDSVVILSPASASFDMFVDYEERGKVFKNIVNNI